MCEKHWLYGLRRDRSRTDRKKAYYEKNKERILKTHLRYEKHKRSTDQNFWRSTRWRTRLNQALRNNQGRIEEVTSCTREFLRAHIENQFTEGMSWENYGRKGWHVDHITPLAAFDCSTEEVARTAFHYTNLRPRWWRENLKKAELQELLTPTPNSYEKD